ncbi:hypothetical protein QU487_04750 [Crenobacter sp. SG2305]|uniref:hypothetical protein n=1 Tax=Crenobacter oryzisoli TaxID=3056844 RepID=UPI0025AB27F8|nr:hypothetical protein [Crenobacter sp. SG2305]MDN0082063.1 hypothetical protein [Crenobacter sp. SG2305]
MMDANRVFRRRLCGALSDYKGEELKKMPSNVNSKNCHKVLQGEHLIDAGILVSGYLGMDGSSGDVGLYDLLLSYCLNPVKRAEINAIIRRK